MSEQQSIEEAREALLAKIKAMAKKVLGEELYQALDMDIVIHEAGKRVLRSREAITIWTLKIDEAIRKGEEATKGGAPMSEQQIDEQEARILKEIEEIHRQMHQAYVRIKAKAQEQRKMLVQSLLKTLKEAEAAIDRGQLRETQLPSVWDSIEEYHLHDEAELMTAYERVNTKLHQAWDRWIDEFVTELDQIEVEPTVKGVNEGMRKREKADQELEDLRYAWGFDADDPRLTDAFRRLDERIKAAREERERRHKALQREAAKPFVYYLVHYWAKTACKEDDEGGPCEQLLSIPALHADPDEGGWWTCVAAEGFGDYALRKVRLPYAVRVDRVEVPLEAWEEQEIPYWLPREQTPYGDIITLWPGMETEEAQ